ncbi:hypothetical protein BASA83_010831 [Batrachochytrium salamandrivorans]|nr:hypothetical protein BASA83_010831 [Batrachochytrium salamandrivorans]
MDIDLARRGPLTSSKDNRGLVKDSALFVGLGLGRKLLPPEALRTDVMNMEDGNRLENCKGDNSARGMGSEARKCILVSALSSLKKLLLPGTLRLGPLSHVDTFFVDCGADDLFMDSKLAADLQIPLLELSPDHATFS